MNSKIKNNKIDYMFVLEIGIIIVLVIAIVLVIFSKKNAKEGEIVLSENINSIYVSERKSVDAEVRNYQDAVIIYKSSDESILKFDDNIMEGISVGKAKVTISCNIKDVAPISFDVSVQDGGGIINYANFPNGELVIGVNKTFNLDNEIIYNPSNGKPNSKVFTSSNNDVATISELGVLTSKKVGMTNITTHINTNINSTITVFVVSDDNPGEIIKNVDKIVFKDKNIKIKKGETKKIEYEISPKESSMKYVTVNVSDKNVISINNNEIKGLNVGDTTILYKTIDNKEYKLNVSVIDGVIDEDIILSTTDLTMEENMVYEVKITTNTGKILSNPKITCSDLSVTSYEYHNGVLKISSKKSGSSLITIENGNGKKKTIKVNVVKKISPTPTPIIIEEKEITDSDYENRGYSISTSTKNLNRTYDVAIKEDVNSNTSIITFTAKNNNLNIIVCDYLYGSDKCDINKGARLKEKTGTYEIDGYGMHVINVYEEGKVLIPYYIYLAREGYTVNNMYSTKELAINNSIKVQSAITFTIDSENINKLMVCWTDENSDCDPLTELNTVKPITKINNKLYLNNPKLWKVKVLELDKDNNKIRDIDTYYVNVIK